MAEPNGKGVPKNNIAWMDISSPGDARDALAYMNMSGPNPERSTSEINLRR